MNLLKNILTSRWFGLILFCLSLPLGLILNGLKENQEKIIFAIVFFYATIIVYFYNKQKFNFKFIILYHGYVIGSVIILILSFILWLKYSDNNFKIGG